MSDVTLYEWGLILLSIVMLGVGYIVWNALIVFWPQPWRGIAQYGSALFQYFAAVRYADSVSSVSAMSSEDFEADERTDGRTDIGPSALGLAIKNKQVDVIRSVIIDTLIDEGADVALVRSLLKGSNDAIGAEVAASRQRLGITPSERMLIVRDSGKPEREIAF